MDEATNIMDNLGKFPTNPGNTSPVMFNGSLLALCEGGPPIEIDKGDLEDERRKVHQEIHRRFEWFSDGICRAFESGRERWIHVRVGISKSRRRWVIGLQRSHRVGSFEKTTSSLCWTRSGFISYTTPVIRKITSFLSSFRGKRQLGKSCLR